MDSFHLLIKKAIIRRIAYVLVAFLITLLTGYFNNAKAETYVYPASQKFRASVHDTTSLFTTKLAACNNLIGKPHQDDPTATITEANFNGANACSMAYTKPLNPTLVNLVSVFACNGTDTINGSNQCTSICNAPSTFNTSTNTCETVNNCAPKINQKSQFSLPTDSANTVCFQGCNHRTQDSICLIEGSTQTCYITGFNLGTTCTTPVTESPTTTAFDCIKKGQASGTVNGMTVCVPLGTAGAAPTTTKVNAAKSTTTAAGTSSTSTTTTNNNNKVTTTTITTAANGTQTTESKEQDKNSFCEENPNSKICKDEKSKFDGACSSGFFGEGDAIQLAIAKEQHNTNCELFKKENPISTTGQAAMAGTDTGTSANPSKTENRQIVNVSDMINEGSGIGGGTFQDKFIPLKGQGITLPFSKLNFIVQLLGSFLLAGAYLNAARIVGVR